jgi:flagellar motor switch/type III secretory pathway protein FliN
MATERGSERENGRENGRGGGEEGANGGALLRRAAERPSEPSAEGGLPVARIALLPVQLDVRIPLPDFRVSDLVGLAPGRVVASEWPSSNDVPLICGDVQLVWTEFEVVDQTLAVRVTRLV